MKIVGKLALTLLGALGCTGAYAKKYFGTDEGKRYSWDKVNDLAYGLCKGIAKIIPNDNYPYAFEYDNRGFMAGNPTLDKLPKNNAKWNCGYGKVSLLPDDVGTGEYYVGGYLHLPPNVATDVLDDQCFRCVALSDERGITVFGVIDCVGISNHDIRDIRILLENFAKEHNILSINISAIHAHSEIDTQGLWGDLFSALYKNPLKILNGERDFLSGRNAAHMEELKHRCAETIKSAVLEMKPGKLSYSLVDGSRFMRDKRPPYVMLTDILNLKFTPDDGSCSTRIVCMSAHPTQLLDDNKSISADYPYYLCQELEKYGENAMFLQSAELAIATERAGNVPENLERMDEIIEYGRAIARYCIENSPKAEKELKPLLNVRNHELFIGVDNYLFALIGKLRLVTNNIVRVGDKVSDIRFATEVGMAKFGDELNIAMVPGELAPELLVGGCFDENESYNHEKWEFSPMKDDVDGYLHCIGLCNDAIGYIVPDNDFGSVIAPLHYEEAVSTGKHAASTIVSAFERVAKEFE